MDDKSFLAQIISKEVKQTKILGFWVGFWLVLLVNEFFETEFVSKTHAQSQVCEFGRNNYLISTLLLSYVPEIFVYLIYIKK